MRSPWLRRHLRHCRPGAGWQSRPWTLHRVRSPPCHAGREPDANHLPRPAAEPAYTAQLDEKSDIYAELSCVLKPGKPVFRCWKVDRMTAAIEASLPAKWQSNHCHNCHDFQLPSLNTEGRSLLLFGKHKHASYELHMPGQNQLLQT